MALSSVIVWDRKIKVIGTGIALLAMFFIIRPLGAHAVVGGPLCNVPADYPTIQAAVNNPGCTTVNVAAGTYTENVVINHSLNLKGAKAGVDARSRSGSESVINGDASADVTINADNVTVDGFTLNGPTSSGSAALVMQNANTGETIKNNIVNNLGRAASITTSNTTFSQNLVRNTSTSSDGFQANTNPVHNDTISNNNFSGANSANYHADITFIEGNSNITISGNKSISDGTLAAIFKTTGAKISDNTIIGTSDSSAIYIGGADSNVQVRGNKVTAAGNGVKVANDFGIGANSNVTILNNTLRNNKDGIKIGTYAVAADNTVVAHRNQLTGNSNNGFENATTFNAIATCNWWGAKSGPGPVGPGSGDKVTTYVAFAPWLTSGTSGDENDENACSSGRASGDLRMSNPSQRIIFNVVNSQNGQNNGSVEYWNFDYPGGLHYKATVACSYVDPQTGEARFMFQIPSGFPGLSGQYVVAYVKHVKNGPDLYGHSATGDASTATQWCENGVGFTPTMYPVTKGNVKIDSNNEND